MLQDLGKMKAGVLEACIPTGITAVLMRWGMDEWDLELGRLQLCLAASCVMGSVERKGMTAQGK